MISLYNKIKENILNVLLPITCVGCGKEGQYICQDCEIFLSETCPEPAEGVSSVWAYEGLMEKLIHKIKYEGCHHIISELVEIAFQKFSLDLPKDTVITFVPMYKKREKERGFNQAELIAQEMGQLLDLVKQPLLEKVRDTKSQTKLDAKERLENVKDAFRLTSDVKTSDVSALTSEVNSEVPRNVLLVDDVYTSGATMQECQKVLKKAGVKNVFGFTLARTV